MPLSPEELKQARVAGEEIERRDAERIFCPGFSVLGFLMLLIHLGAHSGRVESYAFPVGLLFLGVIHGLLYRKLNRRYPANLRLLESLCERDPSLFEHVDGHPVLRKTEEQRRPLLWRVDQFLSGRARSNNPSV
jgi:hypothetical protein